MFGQSEFWFQPPSRLSSNFLLRLSGPPCFLLCKLSLQKCFKDFTPTNSQFQNQKGPIESHGPEWLHSVPKGLCGTHLLCHSLTSSGRLYGLYRPQTCTYMALFFQHISNLFLLLFFLNTFSLWPYHSVCFTHGASLHTCPNALPGHPSLWDRESIQHRSWLTMWWFKPWQGSVGFWTLQKSTLEPTPYLEYWGLILDTSPVSFSSTGKNFKPLLTVTVWSKSWPTLLFSIGVMGMMVISFKRNLFPQFYSNRFSL